MRRCVAESQQQVETLAKSLREEEGEVPRLRRL